MKTSLGMLLIALLAVGVVAAWATAQQQHHQQDSWTDRPMGRPWTQDQQDVQGPRGMAGPGMGQGMRGAPGSCPCAMCQMGKGGQMGQRMESMMRDAGIPEEEITRSRILMKARLHPADPQSLMALQDQLNLSDQQVNDLEQILDSAQERALALLTPEQWQQVRQLRPQALSMMEIHQNIMPQMRAQMREEMRARRPGWRGNPPLMPEDVEEQEMGPYGRPQSDQSGKTCPPPQNK